MAGFDGVHDHIRELLLAVAAFAINAELKHVRAGACRPQLHAELLAELAERAEVFDVAADRVARLARGSVPRLFLLICAVAAWLGVFKGRETTRAMESRLDVLRSMGRMLEVDDPARIAVVKKQDQWMDEDRWDLYLPPGEYRICMATRELGHTGIPPAMKSAPIRPGRLRY